MGCVKRIIVNNKEILVVDYSRCKQDDMIALADEAKGIILKENRPQLLLSCYNNTFVTPKFMRHAEKVVGELQHLIGRSALIGLNTPKKMILKAFNLLLKTEYRSFDSEREAIEYLIDEPLTDRDKVSFIYP